MSRPPRLKDVAELAGVSQPTVSRVLNGKPGVAASTHQRVVAALAELGFDDVPEATPTHQLVVGLVCGDLVNPVFATLLHQVGLELASHGFISHVGLADDRGNSEEACVESFLRAGVDAVVFIGGRHAQLGTSRRHYADLIADNRCVVLVNGAATDLAVPHIRCDEGSAARLATTHLLHLGHRKIGLVVGEDRYVPTDRIITTYRSTLNEAGADEPPNAIVHTGFTFEAARAAARRLLADGFTAVVAANDLMALGAIAAANSMGLSVPDDISVIGYDGTDFTALTNPPLTTLRQPFEDMARLMAEAIAGHFRSDSTYIDHFVFEPQLVVRGSTGPARS